MTLVATLVRLREVQGATLGVLVIDSLSFATLEPKWVDNQRNVSCIPTGWYGAAFMPRSASGKYRNVWHIVDVENRSGILIHNGNVVDHTRGCILLGERHGVIAQQPAVLSSHSAMRRLRDHLHNADFTLHIWGQEHAANAA